MTKRSWTVGSVWRRLAWLASINRHRNGFISLPGWSMLCRNVSWQKLQVFSQRGNTLAVLSSWRVDSTWIISRILADYEFMINWSLDVTSSMLDARKVSFVLRANEWRTSGIELWRAKKFAWKLKIFGVLRHGNHRVLNKARVVSENKFARVIDKKESCIQAHQTVYRRAILTDRWRWTQAHWIWCMRTFWFN